MELIAPSKIYKNSFISAVREFQANSDTNEREKGYFSISISELESDFDGYVERERSKARGENLPEGYVPETILWLIDNDEFIGKAGIRHVLTEHLQKTGGHIGYDIRPSKRKQGYGTHILRLALLKAKEMGITRALLTCDPLNSGSRKIIEKNGGVLQEDAPGYSEKLRFWIDIP